MDDPKVLSKRQQIFNNETYWKCGVYFQRYGKRLHRAVWELNNGEIPKGYDIHHIDFDHVNNQLSNLALLPEKEHCKLHVLRNIESGVIGTISQQALDAAAEWHGSEDGKDWHKQHYENNKHLLHKRINRQCTQCGKIHNTCKVNTETAFCSNNCKSQYRRLSGKDNEERNCIICGTTFIINKYSKVRSCSRICGNKLLSITKTKSVFK